MGMARMGWRAGARKRARLRRMSELTPLELALWRRLNAVRAVNDALAELAVACRLVRLHERAEMTGQEASPAPALAAEAMTPASAALCALCPLAGHSHALPDGRAEGPASRAQPGGAGPEAIFDESGNVTR